LSGDEIYEELRRQIDKMPVGMPPTTSGVEMRILKHLFTPDEAKIALHLNIFLEPLERIYRRIKQRNTSITIHDVKETLDWLVMKGSILCDEQDGVTRYSYALFIVGMYEFQVDRMTPDFYEAVDEYTRNEFHEEYTRTGIPQLRVVPIEQSIPLTYHIATYDDMRRTIKKTQGQFGIANCICRQGKDLIGHPCQVTKLRETCILFPPMSLYYHKIGRGRLITKETALNRLHQAEDAGLVIQPSNAQQPQYLCCCCGDCCAILVSTKIDAQPAALFATNYYAEVDPESCVGCGTCIQRCQMNAPSLVESTTSINLTRCIGCGLCIPTCPSTAITLHRKDQEITPPQTADDLYVKIMAKKLGTWGILKLGVKKILGQKI
jgi:NAD-dependent dihydropyrimidine dehydrogenase PreA subunit